MGRYGRLPTTPRNRPRSSDRCRMKESDSSERGRDSRLIERFLEMMSAERGAARNTLTAYQRDLSDYADFLKAHGSDLKQAAPEHIRNFLASLAGQGLKPASAA